MDDASGRGPEDAVPDAFEKSHFDLLKDPKWTLKARHSVEFGEQLASSWIVTMKRENYQAQNGSRREAENQRAARNADHACIAVSTYATLAVSARNRESERALLRVAPNWRAPSAVNS